MRSIGGFIIVNSRLLGDHADGESKLTSYFLILVQSTEQVSTMLATHVLEELLTGELEFLEKTDFDLGGLIDEISASGDQHHWYQCYRAIALPLLEEEKRNFGRVIILILLTREFQKVMPDECLLIWFKRVLGECDCSTLEIPGPCVRSTKSSWFFFGYQVLLLLLLLRPILF